MTQATIIEESEAPDGRRIVTVRTDTCREYTFDLDATVKAVAVLLSDREDERRGGWILNTGWFEQELRLLGERSRAKVGASA